MVTIMIYEQRMQITDIPPFDMNAPFGLFTLLFPNIEQLISKVRAALPSFCISHYFQEVYAEGGKGKCFD